MNRFIYLRTGLAVVLGFVGIKMIVADYFRVPTFISLAIIATILGLTIAASMVTTRNQGSRESRK
jgi:tellurite resistance protein TerC